MQLQPNMKNNSLQPKALVRGNLLQYIMYSSTAKEVILEAGLPGVRNASFRTSAASCGGVLLVSRADECQSQNLNADRYDSCCRCNAIMWRSLLCGSLLQMATSYKLCKERTQILELWVIKQIKWLLPASLFTIMSI